MPSTTGTPLIAITQTYSRNYTPVAVAGGVVGAALLVMILVFAVLRKKDDCGAIFKSSKGIGKSVMTYLIIIENKCMFIFP